MNNMQSLLIGCYILNGGLLTGQETKQTCKPNIIFILTDDHRWDALGYTGNKIIRTPEMDKLARFPQVKA